jgi:polysaccharide biosynthesis/export protein
MIGLKHFFFLIALTLFVSACSTGPDMPMSGKEELAASDSLLRLEPGDKINIKVYGEDSLTGEYMVDEDGNINVPLAGSIKAGGTTKSVLQKKIADSLIAKGFQQKPYVTVEVAALRPFFINGEIGSPGAYPYAPGLDVFQAVAMAGGFTPRASTSKIIVTRTKQGKKYRFTATQDTPIWPGDSIMIYQRLF